MRRRFFGILGILLLVPSLALAAEPILVGGLFDDSGPGASIGTPARLVAEMTVEQLNAAGGILGRPVKLVTVDTQSDADLALRGARKLNEQDKVLAIIGPNRTGSGMAVKTYLEEQGLPTLMQVGGDVVLAPLPSGPVRNIFKIPQRTSTCVEKVYGLLKARGLTKVGLLTATDGFGKDGKGILEAKAAEFGLSVVASEVMDPAASDFSAQAFKLAVAQPQAVVVWTIGPSAAIATKNFAALPGKKPLIVQSHAMPDPKFIELAGKAAEGVIMPGTKVLVADDLPADDPQKALIQKFVADYKARGLEAKFPINAHSGYAFDTLLLLKQALTKAGKADRASLRDALESLQKIVGISGVFSFTPQDHNGVGLDSVAMLEVKNGKFTLVK